MKVVFLCFVLSTNSQGAWLQSGDDTLYAAWKERDRVCLGVWHYKHWETSPEFGCDFAITFSRRDGFQFHDTRQRRIEGLIKKGFI